MALQLVVSPGYEDTALHRAAEWNIENVSCLVRAGAKVNVRSSTGDTPLHHAARYGKLDIVWLLLACNAEVDAQNNMGDTPLHLSVRHSDVVKALIRAGADRNLTNKFGQTPLDIARSEESSSVEIRTSVHDLEMSC